MYCFSDFFKQAKVVQYWQTKTASISEVQSGASGLKPAGQ